MRQCEHWLKSYLAYTSGQESPDTFHLWCGFSLLAAVLERRVWLDRAYYTLYPNLYIILVSGSAVSRKSTAIRIATERLAGDMDLPTLAIEGSRQALYRELLDRFEETGVGAGYVVDDEIGNWMGAETLNTVLIKALTKCYDCPETLKYHSLGQGKWAGEKVCLNLLGGTTPDWIRDSLPSHSIGGGFTSRVSFVFHPPSWRRVAHPRITEKEIELKRKLRTDLDEIVRLEGEYALDRGAYEYFEDWYVDVFRADEHDPLLRGYYARKHDTMLKLSMVIAAAQRDEMIVKEDDVKAAHLALNANEKFLPHVIRLVEETGGGREVDRVLGYIARKSKIKHSELLRNVSRYIDAKRLADIVDMLKESGEIEVEKVKGGRIYRVKGK